MKRRSFIRVAAIAGIVIATPAIYYYTKHRRRKISLDMPYILGRFCNDEEILEIGRQYRIKVQAENNKKQLTELLLLNKDRKSLTDSQLDEILEKEIQSDFTAYKTIVINGWVISPTEARQCALFSLSHN